MRNSVCFLLMLAAPFAYSSYLTANDPVGTSSFNSAGNWDDGVAPFPGNSYYTLGYLLRTPAVEGNYTFNSNMLMVGGGNGGGANPFLTDGTVNLNCLLNKTPSGAIITVPYLVLDAGYIRDGMGSEDVWTIDGYIYVTENGGGLANQCQFNINSWVSGSGPLYIADNGNSDPRRTIYWNNPNNDYWGTIQLLGPSPDRCRLTFSPGSRMNFRIWPYGDSNKIFGMGTATFDGIFYFDLWGASTTVGDSWLIANAAVQSFGPNFMVADFLPMPGGLWGRQEANGAFYIFDTQTGMLSVAQPISIITPNGGERYVAGKPVQITYTTSGQVPIYTVNVEYSTDGWNWYAWDYGVPNTGIYEWFAPDIESNTCFIRISSTDFWQIADTSDNPFTVFHCPAPIPGDINEDCYVNLQDLAVLAQSWLLCGDPYNPDCTIR